MIKNYLLLLITLVSFGLNAQKEYTISGYIKDESSGETLIGANIINIDNPIEGTSTNTYGFYSLSLREGNYKINVSYLGFQSQSFEIDLNKDITFDVNLSEGVAMEEIVVTSDREERKQNVESTQLGKIDIPVESIKKLPALFGEVDILKVLQLLPGVLSSGEGASGFYVRGGGPDQNLVLLDDAVVYNSGHLLGFFSVFNADAIKNTSLIKGGMPANYGGRVSSVLDIQMKEGNNKKYRAEGGIGIISSRLMVEGPIVKDKSSFMVSGRRTYALDLAQPALKGGDFEGTNYYFYDLNTKWNYSFSKKDRLYLSTYFGRDVLVFAQPKRDFSFELPYGNSTATLRWNHLYSDKLFSNLSVVYNDYKFQFNGRQEDFAFNLSSGIEDYSAKLDFDYYHNNKHSIKFGANYTFHTLTPSTASASNGDVDFDTNFKPKNAHESAIYVLDDIKFNSKISLNVGARFSAFTQMGPYTSTITGKEFGKGDAVRTYTGFEPRASFKWSLANSASLKGGITRAFQYLHLVSNSSSTLPADVWVGSSELVKPQIGIQYALGLFKNFKEDQYETSIEIYYKDLQNQIDYADSYVNDITKEVENSFVFGKGRAYGAEFFLKKSTGRLNGWIGYTLSRTERSFDDIEDARWYPATYDKTHDLSVVANYALTKKWDVSGVFIYGTGRLFTPTNGFFFVDQNINLFYGPRNSARLDAYHRFDLSATYTRHPDSKRKWKGSWTFSVYNAYNRKNPFFINFDTDVNFETGETTIEGSKITIFPIIPSITYNFKFN